MKSMPTRMLHAMGYGNRVWLFVVFIIYQDAASVGAKTLCEVKIRITNMTESLSTEERICHRIKHYDDDGYDIPLYASILVDSNCSYDSISYRWMFKSYHKSYTDMVNGKPDIPEQTTQTVNCNMQAQYTLRGYGLMSFNVSTTIQFTENDNAVFWKDAYYFYVPTKEDTKSMITRIRIRRMLLGLRLFYKNVDDIFTSMRSCEGSETKSTTYYHWASIEQERDSEGHQKEASNTPEASVLVLNGSCEIDRFSGRAKMKTPFYITCNGFRTSVSDRTLNYTVYYDITPTGKRMVHTGTEPDMTVYFENAGNKDDMYFVNVSVTVTTGSLSFTTEPVRVQVLPDIACEIHPDSIHRDKTLSYVTCIGPCDDANYTIYYNSSVQESVVMFSGQGPLSPMIFPFDPQAVPYFGYVHVIVQDKLLGSSTPEPIKIQYLPEKKNECYMKPWSGYQNATSFSVICNLNNITDDTTPSYTIYLNTTDSGGFYLHKGPGPLPPFIITVTGDSANNYTLDIHISIEGNEGAVLEQDLFHIQVKPNPLVVLESTDDIVESIGSMISDTGQWAVLDDFLDSEDTTAAAELVLDVSESLNTDSGNHTNYTDTERKNKRIQIRESISEYVSQLPVSNVIDIQEVTQAVNSLTFVPEEVNEKTVENAMETYSNVADVLQTQITNASTETADLLTGMILNGTTNLLDVKSTDTNVTESLNETQRMKNSVNKIVSVVEKVADTAMDVVTRHDPPKVFHTSKLDVVVMKRAPSDITGKSLSQSRVSKGHEVKGSFSLPNDTTFSDVVSAGANGLDVGVQMLFYEDNPFKWDVSAESVTSPVVDLKLKNTYHENINITNQTEPIHLEFSTGAIVEVAEFVSNITAVYNTINILNYTTSQESVVVLKMLSSIDNYLILRVTANDSHFTDTSFKVYASIGRYPTTELVNEYGVSVHKGDNFTVYNLLAGLNTSQVTDSVLNISVGILPILSREADDYVNQMLEQCGNGDYCTSEVPIVISVETYKTSCVYWDKSLDSWSSDGCKVSPLTTFNAIHCDCTHLTAFAGGFLVQPNFVNPFSDAALFLTFFSNPIVVTTVVVIWIIYALLVCWARKVDRDDQEKCGLIVLEDNNASDNYTYLVCVVTSWWRNAGTSASVSMYLQGEVGQSSKHCLKSGLTDSSHIMASGAEDWFIMNTPNNLGRLQYIYIWHDNSGSSPAWNLSRIIVKDLQTNETWVFPFKSWIAVNMGSMSTFVSIQAKTEQEVASKGRKEFMFKLVNDLRDEHLWLSIASKPIKSTFTRVQRLSCGLSLLLTTMLTSIMFHGVPTDDPADQRKVGGISFSVTDIIIGIESSLIMFPINLLIMQIFTRIRHKPEKSEKTYKYNPRSELERSRSRKHAQLTENFEQNTGNTRQGKSLPWWFVYIGWFLVIFTCLVSSYFVMLYGLKYGPRKSVDWLISFFTAFFQSTLVTQPMKVIGIAVVVTMILKTPLKMDNHLEGSTEVKCESTGEKASHSIPNKLTQALMEDIRRKLWLDEEVRLTLKDIGLYLVYVAIVLVIVHGHRSVTELYRFTHFLEDEFFLLPRYKKFGLNNITKAIDMWKYHDKVAPIFGNMANQTDTALEIPSSFYLVGPYRIRQQRVEIGSCSFPKHLREKYSQILETCDESYWMGNEDTQSYNHSWRQPITDSSQNTQWTYRSAWDLKTTPFVGNLATYGGGGYILIVKPLLDSGKIKEVESSQWIDERTRAVFLEFTIYNPNRNIFSVVIILFEFSSIGPVLPYYQIFTAKLYNYGSDLEVFVAVCELLFLFFNIVFTYIEYQRIKRIGRKQYFRDFWSYIEIIQLSLSYSAIVVFFQRMVAVSRVLEDMKASDGTDFLSFYPAITLDFVLLYITAFLVGLIILKIFKFLKFNKRMYMTASTCSYAKVPLICYVVFSGVAMVAFAHSALLLFGKSLYDYKSFGQCIITLYNFFLGVSDFKSLSQSDKIWGPIFFFAFVFIFNISLITFFLGIINEAITRVKAECMQLQADLQVVDYMYSRIKNLL